MVRPGDYIHEPARNVDWWEATGAETLLVHVVVKGSVQYLGPHHTVLQRIATADRRADYCCWCEQGGRGAAGSAVEAWLGGGNLCSAGTHVLQKYE